MQTVGNYLRQEREAKNISLGEVAQLTKISEFYLDFLEKDDYEKLPQGPYIKGYISSYARLIGSNADEAIKLYNSLQEQMNQIEAAQTERSEVAARPAPIASLQEKIGSSIKELSASFKAKTASLKIGTFSSESHVAPLRKFSAFFENSRLRPQSRDPLFRSSCLVIKNSRRFNKQGWPFDIESQLFTKKDRAIFEKSRRYTRYKSPTVQSADMAVRLLAFGKRRHSGSGRFRVLSSVHLSKKSDSGGENATAAGCEGQNHACRTYCKGRRTGANTTCGQAIRPTGRN